MNLSSGIGNQWMPKARFIFYAQCPPRGGRRSSQRVHCEWHAAPRNKSNWDPPPIGFDRTESGSKMPGVRQLHQF